MVFNGEQKKNYGPFKLIMDKRIKDLIRLDNRPLKKVLLEIEGQSLRLEYLYIIHIIKLIVPKIV